MRTAGFDDKLLAKFDKLDSRQARNVLTRLVGQKQFMLRVFDHLDEGVAVCDGGLRPLLVNRRARAMFGWRPGRQDLGEDLCERLGREHPLREILVSLRGAMRAIDAYEYPWGGEGERTLSLTTLPIEAAAGFDGDEAGEPEGPLWILLLRDVTDRKRRQAEHARARRLASMATLTSGIAHEIKNPLNSLKIHAQLLQGEVDKTRESGRPLDPARAERATRVILEETDRMARIVEEFLAAARPRSPQLEARDVRPLLETLERILRPECERLGIALTVGADPDLPPLMMDEHLLLQALRNLARNAIEAAGERIEQARADGEAYLPAVGIEARLAGDAVNVTVSDNGPGIAQDRLDQIFEPYFTTKHGGTGLGLMVVYRIVTEHRGALHVDTKPGATRFIVGLPLHQKPVRLIEGQAVVAPAGGRAARETKGRTGKA